MAISWCTEMAGYFNARCHVITYTLFTDASNYAYSDALTQAVDGHDNLRPIAYTLSSFSHMQQKWSLTEKEALAFTNQF